MPIDINVQAGDSVLFTEAPAHWNRDRPYRVIATTVNSISVESDGHHFNIDRKDLERLGLTLVAEK